MVVGAAVAAALALPGCAPAGYNASDYGDGSAVDPVAASPTAEPTPTGAAAPTLAPADITSELTGTTITRMGEVVVDQQGYVLYRFDQDKTKPDVQSTCAGDCAKIWPPALTQDGKPRLDGVDPADVGTVTRADGTKQLTIGKWPVYRYAGDRKPGQWRGQNVSGTWFVVKPDGTKNLTCVPPAAKPIAPPAAKPTAPPAAPPDSGTGAAGYSY